MNTHTGRQEHPHEQLAALHATIVTLGRMVLDEKLGIYTDHCEPLIEPGSNFRHASLPAYDNMSVSGPHHGHEPSVALTVGQRRSEADPPYYIFWADGSVGKARRDTFARGASWRDGIEQVSVRELRRLKEDLARARLTALLPDDTVS